MGYRGRDVEIVELDGVHSIVMACDSAGAIGSKERDLVKVPPELVGRLTARVSLLEILAVGAKPVMISAAICNEPNPTGDGIIRGIEEELNSLGYGELSLAVSTEKNFETCQTGLGITIVGVCETNKLRVGLTSIGDWVYCVGLPKVGNEVKGSDDPEIIDGHDIEKLLSMPSVHDIIPVGSKGVAGEAALLADHLGFQFKQEEGCSIDLEKSGGPSTSLIFTCEAGYNPDLSRIHAYVGIIV